MKDSFVDDAIAKVTELGTVGAMKWLEAQMQEYAEQRVREEAVALAAKILQEIANETPISGNFSATACVLIAAERLKKKEQPWFLYNEVEYTERVKQLTVDHYGSDKP